MKRLVVVANDLERSGKSSIARAVHHHLAKECEVDSLFVTSDENDLSDDFTGEYWDLDEAMPAGPVIDALEESEAVVVDVHTGGARNWADLCNNIDMENILADLGAEMTLIVPNTGGVRCNEEIIDIVELFADSADYVIAHTNVDDRDETKWKGSEAEKATRYLGSLEIEVPTLTDDLQAALDSAGQDLSKALANAENLPRFAEVQVTQWLEDVSRSFEAASDYIVADASELALEY